jgi:hypothetical protein
VSGMYVGNKIVLSDIVQYLFLYILFGITSLLNQRCDIINSSSQFIQLLVSLRPNLNK